MVRVGEELRQLPAVVVAKGMSRRVEDELDDLLESHLRKHATRQISGADIASLNRNGTERTTDLLIEKRHRSSRIISFQVSGKSKQLHCI